MKLIMCCQVIEGRDFEKDLRFSIVAAAFWKRVYPEGKVYVATNGIDRFPDKYKGHVKLIHFNFEKYLPAFGRTVFMNSYVASPMFDSDTVFAGHDVLFLKQLPSVPSTYKVVTNYRYHPTQPYCSDFLWVRDKKYSIEIMQEVYDAHRWMPAPIVNGAGDQLAYTVVFGMPEKEQFKAGCGIQVPRKDNVYALPADEYLFTPCDYFTPTYDQFEKEMTPSPSYEQMMATKTALHFKGNRKEDFFRFGQWAHENDYVDLSVLEK
jgi:hypothetical protein